MHPTLPDLYGQRECTPECSLVNELQLLGGRATRVFPAIGAMRSECSLCPANCEFEQAKIIAAQRKSGLTGRTAASTVMDERQEWAEKVIFRLLRRHSHPRASRSGLDHGASPTGPRWHF